MKNIFENFGNKKECYETHPPLILTVKDKTSKVYGGSCAYPAVKADVYVSLDWHAVVFTWEAPWMKKEDLSRKEHIRFPIKDFFVPEQTEQFEACLDYMIAKIQEGKSIHVGCGAGHGRTGLVLSALVQKIHNINKNWEAEKLLSSQQPLFNTKSIVNPNLSHILDSIIQSPEKIQENKKVDTEGNQDDDFSAIDYVRTKYCKKAVENIVQVLFLNAHYGVKIPRGSQADFLKIDAVLQDELQTSIAKIVKNNEFDEYANVIDEIDFAIKKLERKNAASKDVILNPETYPSDIDINAEAEDKLNTVNQDIPKPANKP